MLFWWECFGKWAPFKLFMSQLLREHCKWMFSVQILSSKIYNQKCISMKSAFLMKSAFQSKVHFNQKYISNEKWIVSGKVLFGCGFSGWSKDCVYCHNTHNEQSQRLLGHLIRIRRHDLNKEYRPSTNIPIIDSLSTSFRDHPEGAIQNNHFSIFSSEIPE